MKAVKKVQVKSSSILSYVDTGQGFPIVLIHGLWSGVRLQWVMRTFGRLPKVRR